MTLCEMNWHAYLCRSKSCQLSGHPAPSWECGNVAQWRRGHEPPSWKNTSSVCHGSSKHYYMTCHSKMNVTRKSKICGMQFIVFFGIDRSWALKRCLICLNIFSIFFLLLKLRQTWMVPLSKAEVIDRLWQLTGTNVSGWSNGPWRLTWIHE